MLLVPQMSCFCVVQQLRCNSRVVPWSMLYSTLLKTDNFEKTLFTPNYINRHSVVKRPVYLVFHFFFKFTNYALDLHTHASWFMLLAPTNVRDGMQLERVLTLALESVWGRQ
jgi:hypothetical protein